MFQNLTYAGNPVLFSKLVQDGHCVSDAHATLSVACHAILWRKASEQIEKNKKKRSKSPQKSDFFSQTAVDGVIVVHYRRAACRKRTFKRLLQERGLPTSSPRLHWAEHFDGDTALTLGIVNKCVACSLLIRPKRFSPVELTQASCTLNHLYAYHLAMLLGWNRAMILEDDAGLPSNFALLLQNGMRVMPKNWSIYNFGCPYPTRHAKLHGGSLACSRGYVLTRAAFSSFLQNAQTVGGGADWMVHRLSAKTEVKHEVRTWHSGIPVIERSVQNNTRLSRTRADDCIFKTWPQE